MGEQIGRSASMHALCLVPVRQFRPRPCSIPEEIIGTCFLDFINAICECHGTLLSSAITPDSRLVKSPGESRVVDTKHIIRGSGEPSEGCACLKERLYSTYRPSSRRGLVYMIVCALFPSFRMPVQQ